MSSLASTKPTANGTKTATSSASSASSASAPGSANTAAYAAQLASQQQGETNDQSQSDSQAASDDAGGAAGTLSADKISDTGPAKDPGASDAASIDAKANAGLTMPAPAANGLQPANMAAPAAQASAPMSAATVSAVIQQVTVHMTKAAVDGVDHIKVQLNPPELGHVEVRMEVGPSGHFSAVFAADRPQTVHMLQHNAHELTRSLQNAGIRTDAGSLSFNLRNQNQQNSTPWFGGFADTRPASPSWSNAPDDAPMPAAVYAAPSAGTNRVDIRV